MPERYGRSGDAMYAAADVSKADEVSADVDKVQAA
jgi:hypothetical protein